MKTHPDIDQAKRLKEKKIRETYPDPEEDPIAQSYAGYFDKWGKTYPIEFQINSIKKGRTFPQVSTHVDCMFMAELENRILTSGHDRDMIQGRLVYDLADDGEEYVKLNGKKQVLVKNVILVEKNTVLGEKLLLSGNGRCNLTNSETLESFLKGYTGHGNFLRDACKVFFENDLIQCFESWKLPLLTEHVGKIFPKTN